jgi:hypothetical protein
MHTALKEHFLKKLINFCMVVIDKLVPEPKARYPQTRMAKHVFQHLFNAYCLEVWSGRFDDVPHQNLKGLQDRNFLHFLSATRKILLYVGENDRYYRAWIGLAFIAAREEYERALKSLSRDEFAREYLSQWELDLSNVPESHFQLHKSEFLDMMLTAHLCNLLRMRIDFDQFSAKQEKKVNMKNG